MQDAPNTIKLEMTEGCNFRCRMCGIQGIREARGDYKFMDLETAVHIAGEISDSGWNSKIEFALRGEPLMNPHSVAIIDIFRRNLPKTHLMVTSNATPLLKPPGVHANISRLFDAGLNILALDAYKDSAKAIEQVRGYNAVEIWDYSNASKKESPYTKVKASRQRIFIMEDMEEAVLTGQRVGTKIGNNHCGAGLPTLVEPLAKRCARPFREMAIRYDGQVMLCCNDWRGIYKAGNIDDGSLEEIWNNDAFDAARKHLYHRDRNFGPCKGCDNTSFRVGILPDKVGKQDLPVPTADDRKTVDWASSGEPMTKPVLRPWEK